MKRIAVIGFGASAIGFLMTIDKNKYKIDVYEKEKDIFSTSLSGIRADGKLFKSKGMGGDLDISLAIQQEAIDFYLKRLAKNVKIQHGISFKDEKYMKYFYDHGFEPVYSEFFHIGTEYLKNILSNIYDELLEEKNIKFHFSANVEQIDKNYITIDGEKIEYDYIIVAVGRSGFPLVSNFINKYKDAIVENTVVDLGVRFELPNHIVHELNEKMYEFKIKYLAKTKYMVRTFCNNPSGYVITEKYDDFITVNGHSYLDKKSSNTNFAILVTHKFTKPFNDPINYGKNIAKLSNILAGNNRVILQTYGDFKNFKRTKRLYRVEPTLDEDRYILGDLNLVLPSKTSRSLIDFIDNLNNVIPGVAFHDNLIYGIEVKFYSNKLNNNYFENIKFIGDCSGWTRSITYATAHGIWVARNF